MGFSRAFECLAGLALPLCTAALVAGCPEPAASATPPAEPVAPLEFDAARAWRHTAKGDLRWRTAVMTRNIDAISGHLPGEEEEEGHEEEHAQRGKLSEWGVSSSLHYGWNEHWEAGLGAAWVEGIGNAGLDERLRISPLATWRPTENTSLKLQYNYDRLNGARDEHSVWMGFGFNWGGAEVR